MNDDLKLIKKHYGENMMHLCRELFPTILEEEGLLFELISSHFYYNRELYDDIISNGLKDKFKDYIYGLIDIEINNNVSLKTPKELLKEVGYDLYECKSEKDIQEFIKYYSKGEELCTFSGNRLDICHVFFAVKDGAEKLNRNNYKNPERQDEYGTSVISIQFTKGAVNTLSIKNRYNHTVKNPDATFSNNLDNIIDGLSESFEREYGYKINQNNKKTFEIPSYVTDNNGKYYKYNYEINNIYYCKDNIIIDNFEVEDKYKDKEKYLFADYFIINLSNGYVSVYDHSLSKDAFLYGLAGIKNVQVRKIDNNKLICLKPIVGDNIYLEINDKNQIISYINNNLEFIGSNFMMLSKKIKYLELNKVKQVLHNFLYYNNSLEELRMDELQRVDNFFLRYNNSLINLNLPSLEFVCHDFLENNEVLHDVKLPKLKAALQEFLKSNLIIEELYLPNLEMLGEDSLKNNLYLKSFYAPNLKCLPRNFLKKNNIIERLYLNNCSKILEGVLENNKVLKELYLPSIKEYEISYCYRRNKLLEDLINETITNNKSKIKLNLK